MSRPRQEVVALKAAFWADEARRSHGAATLAAGHALLDHARQVLHDFPNDEQRADDLIHHVRLKQLLDRASKTLSNR